MRIGIAVDDSKSDCKFNKKFGLVPEKKNLENWFNKFDTLRNSNLTGVSFHVGSGCKSSDSFRTAIEEARRCFEYAKKRGYHMSVLDIGGGFIQKEPLLRRICKNKIKKHKKSLKIS